MRAVVVFFAFGVVSLIVYLVAAVGQVSPGTAAPAKVAESENLDESVARVNEWFRRQWGKEQLTPASPADDLTILRRLSLAMIGTVPSMEEIRSFEADPGSDRISRWTLKYLKDPRFADYFSERLARSLVGVEQGPFIVYRRDRLTSWLSEQIQADVPWSETVTQLIASEGLWTDSPAANFITVARIDDESEFDENRLAGRTVRAFLGQRIDCAQCHDHKFDERWKQADFEGLAAFFCQARLTIGGVTDKQMNDDNQPVVYKVMTPGQDDDPGREVTPVVPFHPEWVTPGGSLRAQFASWVTHPENRRFDRAISNRVWGLMFGKPWYAPVDDLKHPEQLAEEDALDVLGTEFHKHGRKLSVLIRLIVESDVFRLDSQSNPEIDPVDEKTYARQLEHWSVYPLVRLRPEQVIGSMFQSGSVRTIDQNSHPFIRLLRLTNESDFLKEYGDLGDDELLQQVGTIPQSLMRMNGRFTQEFTKTDPAALTASSHILRYSADDAAVVENCFLACLSRRPSPEETAFFVEYLQYKPDQSGSGIGLKIAPDELPNRHQRVQDLYWSLFNSPEFSWNH
ncbi:MAG: DUF1549 domain-containing protein [Planctomyces sp.]|nr:DUF1549 domain-containing protein [Planctomyces sp.]